MRARGVAVASRMIDVRLPEPAFARLPIDDEELVDGPGPRTLVEYARVTKALHDGGEPARVLAACGVDAQQWGACVGRWAAVMEARTELAVRLSTMLSSPWM